MINYFWQFDKIKKSPRRFTESLASVFDELISCPLNANILGDRQIRNDNVGIFENKINAQLEFDG